MPTKSPPTTDDPIETTQEPPAAAENVDKPVPAAPDEPTVTPWEDVYLRLKADHGLNPEGDLEPLVEIGLQVLKPRLVDKDVVDDEVRLVITAADELPETGLRARFIPGTRIVHVGDPAIADALMQGDEDSLFEQIAPPTKAHIEAAIAETRDAVEKAGTFNPEA